MNKIPMTVDGYNRLHEEIKGALAPFTELAGCHLSHLYPSGSSLYFTFLINGTDEHDAEATYRQAWDQAARSCASAVQSFSKVSSFATVQEVFRFLRAAWYALAALLCGVGSTFGEYLRPLM